MITEPCLIAADVDKTLLEQVPSQKEERNRFLDGIAPRLISAAEIGTNLAILTGNSMDQLCTRFLLYLLEELCVRRELAPLSRFHFFCQSGGVYFHFPEDDEIFCEIADRVRNADQPASIPAATVMDALTMKYGGQRVAHPRFIDQFYLKSTRIPDAEASMIAEIVEAVAQEFHEDLVRNEPKYRQEYRINSPPEANRAEKQRSTTAAGTGIVYELHLPSGELRRPEVQSRPIPYGLADPFETACTQIALRPILSFRHGRDPSRLFGRDFRTRLIKDIQSKLDTVGLPEYLARPGGRSSIDIAKEKVDKAYALEKLIDRLDIYGVSRKGQKFGSKALYLGDEVIVGGGNDYPVTRIPGLTVLAVSEDREFIPALANVVVPSTILDGPDAVEEVLSTYITDARELLERYAHAEQDGGTSPEPRNAIDALIARLVLSRITSKIEDFSERFDVSLSPVSSSHLKVMHALVTLMCREDDVSQTWLSIVVDQLDKIFAYVGEHAKGLVPRGAYGASYDEEDPYLDTAVAISAVEAAASPSKLPASAAENIRKWLTEPHYAQYFTQLAQHIADEEWQRLDDVFWRVIPFGTGGRRGHMYPIGCNAINDRTIGESAQGLADYVKEKRDDSGELSCAIAYDTRTNSRHFAELCAGILVADGFKVYFLDDYRSTPELSFLIRHKGCSCGIMVTASHNPPSDNAVKVYWSNGGQVLPPHDQGIIDRVMNVQEIHQADFEQALARGDVIICTDELDKAYVSAVTDQRRDGPRELKIVYSPLHGVGESAVRPVLEADGFTDLEVFEPHREPSGSFPNVPGHVSNPEMSVIYGSIMERASEVGADLVLVTDPDCDRMGCAAPLTLAPGAEWVPITGNQIGALLTDFMLEHTSGLTADHYLAKTLVTTEMVRRIGDSYGVATHGNLLVGFKWIGGLMDEKGPDKFLLGMEESHGYLSGQYARDKDGGIACMLMAELAASAKASGESLHEKLDGLYRRHGYHAEAQFNMRMEGSEGMIRMRSLMLQFREQPPETLGGIQLSAVRDYLHGKRRLRSGEIEPLEGPTGDMVMLDLSEDGNYVAVRPSGTEPKVKFYSFVCAPPEELADLDATKKRMEQRLESIENGLRTFSAGV